jgi:large subunit ribosomal protein L37Ae
MGRLYKVGPSGSFGARYGTVVRKRYSTIITALSTPHECPQCHVAAVKRMSVGIWLCRSCGFKFAGGAYVPRTKLGEIAERASRAGVASSLLAELKAEKARKAEVEAKAKAPAKRRRRRAAIKTEPKPAAEGSEETPA